MTSRLATHVRGVQYAARRFRACGYRVTILRTQGARGLSLIVNGHTVAVRAAWPHVRHHRVTINARIYRYRLAVLFYNLHAHARTVTHPDWWVFVRLDQPRASLVVPAAALRPTRKTVALLPHVKCRRSALWGFAGAWERLGRAA